MAEEDERNSSKLNEIDRLYGYQEPIADEEEEDKSIAQQMVEALKRKRENAFGNLKKKW
jgi:hypothetical protein